jgi:hypothetical protein
MISRFLNNLLTDGGEDVSLEGGGILPPPPKKITGTHFLGLSLTQGHI